MLTSISQLKCAQLGWILRKFADFLKLGTHYRRAARIVAVPDTFERPEHTVELSQTSWYSETLHFDIVFTEEYRGELANGATTIT